MNDPDFLFPPVHITEVTEEEDERYQSAVTSPVCDFCFDMRVRWDYPCERFVVDEIEWGSDGEWSCCERCSQLIEAGDWAGLLGRATESWVLRYGTPSAKEQWGIRAIFLGFRQHRTGPRVAFG